MNEFLKSIGLYWKQANFGAPEFWLFPLITVFFIWMFTAVGLKLYKRDHPFRATFLIHRTWIISSMVVAMLLIGLICYWWSANYFSGHHFQLSLLLSQIIAMLVPVICLVRLKKCFSGSGLRKILPQPLTPSQSDKTILLAKKEFNKTKYCFFIPVLGFTMLFFIFNTYKNLITIVFDNSDSMSNSNAASALSDTFDNLQNNNEIILTTLDGLGPDAQGGRLNMSEIMGVNKSALLKAGNINSYNTPAEAKTGLPALSNRSLGSPICEAIWKTFLYTGETKTVSDYKNKVLIVVTDGEDNIGASLSSGKFFYESDDFSEMYPADKVFIIDFSKGSMNPFMQKFQLAGCDIYNAENNKQDYLDGLDNALAIFKNNWYLIYWTIAIYILLSVCSLFINPKTII